MFTSLVRPAVDIAYSFCYIISIEWLHEAEPDERPETCLQR